MTMRGDWNYPTTIRFGAGRVSELPQICIDLGVKQPLLVTDPGLAGLPMVVNAIAHCGEAGINAHVFSAIKSNPTAENVAAGVAAYHEAKHDGVIAFGGGSALDAGKAVALMTNQDCVLWELEDSGANWRRADAAVIPPIIAVPTTAGTGSEVGRAAVITDPAEQVKRVIFHPAMLPTVVIADPLLTVGLPAKLTAATGMDALSHNLEAFCAPSYHPMARGIAVEGMRLIHDYLPRAVADGSDLEARGHMLVASTMGATAFQRGLGAMHALAHPLGALYDAHHGLLNAILMPYVLAANESAIVDDLAYLAISLGLSGDDGVFDWVLELREHIGIPHTLAEIGINAEQAERIGRMASVDPAALSNPIAFSSEQYATLFRGAVQGVLPVALV